MCIRDRSKRIANGEETIEVKKSDEEVVELIKALLGVIPPRISNANVVNVGQMPDMPLGAVVETNCAFSRDSVKPIAAKPLPKEVSVLVRRNCENIENTYYGIKHRDFGEIFEAFANQPLCSNLTLDEARALFTKMVNATSGYLKDFYPLEKMKLC